MRKKGIAYTVIIAAILAILVCGCSGESQQSTAGGNISSVSVGKLNAAAEPDTPYLSYLGSRTDILDSDAYVLYSESCPQSSGNLIEAEYINSSALADKLYERISSGRSPDLTDKPEEGIFQYMSQNYYEDLTDYIDITSPQWEEYAECINYYELGGSRYFFPEHISVSPKMLIYDAGIFEESGMEDPNELLEKGQWNWYTFEKLTRQFAGKKRGAYGIIGDGIAECFISSTGARLFSRNESGKLVYCVSDENIAFAMEYMHGMSDILLNDTHEFGTEVFDGRSCAFVLADENYFRIVSEQFPERIIKAVPFPEDPSAECYYAAAETYGFLVPKGAKNIKGAASFINCGRIADENYGDEEDLLFYGQYELSPVYGEFYCFDDETNAALRELLSQILSDRQESVVNICGNYSAEIDNAVQAFNSLVV